VPDVIVIEDHDEASKTYHDDPADDSLIASTTQAVGQHSFVDSRQPYRENCPPPKYFTHEMLLNPLPVHKDEILKGFVVPPVGGLICTD
jgi:hypothetical protein